MEVVVNLLDLCEVLILHLSSCDALLTVLGRIREQNLVDHDVVNVDLLLGQLNGQPLSLIHGQELGDADGHEGRLVRILKLFVHFLNLCLHGIDAIEQPLLSILSTARLPRLVHHLGHLSEHSTKLILKFNQLDQSLF